MPVSPVVRPAGSFVGLAALLGATSALAAPTEVQPSARQNALVVAVEGKFIVARACAALAGCTTTGGERFAMPAEVDASRAEIESIRLDGTHRVALVTAPHNAGGRWITILFASDKGKAPTVQRIKGTLDQPTGVEGERSFRLLIREKVRDGTRLSFGSRYENAEVCGRPAVIRVNTLDPKEWTLKPTGAHSLTAAEREGATALNASKVARPFGLEQPHALSHRLASSAVTKKSNGATDRALSTRWAESLPGDGAGEFLALTAPLDVPLRGLAWVVRGDDSPEAAAPRQFYVATDQELFVVTAPEDAASSAPGTVYEVRFPQPLKTACVSVVLAGGFVAEGRDQVGLTELRAITDFDGMDEKTLAGKLDGPEADAAEALLLRSGKEGIAATMAVYPDLSFAARQRALDVVDTGGCAQVADFYVDRITGVGAGADFEPALDPVARLARDKLRSCRSRGTDALITAVKREAPGQRRVWAARELAGLDPRRAIAPILEVLTDGSTAPERSGQADDVRRRLRGALAIAARNERAKAAVAEALAPGAFDALGKVAKVDFLRAVGPALTDVSGGAEAFARARSDTSFRASYLLLEPAAHLAAKGDTKARDFIRQSLKGKSAPLRRKAAEVAALVPALAADLRAALDDDNPRVRQTALASLAEGAKLDPAIEPRVIALLEKDPWPFVRVGAADALARAPRTDTGDEALVAAIEDTTPRVRRAALRALGMRGSVGAGQAIHEVADDPKARIDTRIAAIEALGRLCRRESSELLYKLALRAGFQQLPYDQPLGLAALASLGEIKPPDIRERLQRLYAPNAAVAPNIKKIARDAVFGSGRCPAPRPDA